MHLGHFSEHFQSHIIRQCRDSKWKYNSERFYSQARLIQHLGTSKLRNKKVMLHLCHLSTLRCFLLKILFFLAALRSHLTCVYCCFEARWTRPIHRGSYFVKGINRLSIKSFKGLFKVQGGTVLSASLHEINFTGNKEPPVISRHLGFLALSLPFQSAVRPVHLPSRATIRVFTYIFAFPPRMFVFVMVSRLRLLFTWEYFQFVLAKKFSSAAARCVYRNVMLNEL